MDGKTKIKALTRTWHGVMLLQAAYIFYSVGLFSSMTSLVFGTVTVYVLGRLLLGGSSLTRIVLVALSAIGILGSGFAAANGAWAFVHEASFGLIVTVAFAIFTFSLYLHSLRVLMNKAVKAHISHA